MLSSKPLKNQEVCWFDTGIFGANLKILSSLSRSAEQLAIKKTVFCWGEGSEVSDMEKKDRDRGAEQQEFNQLLEEPSEKPFIIDTAELQSIYILSFPHFQQR